MRSGPRDTDPGQGVERTSLCGDSKGVWGEAERNFLGLRDLFGGNQRSRRGTNSSGTQVDPHLPSL